MPEIVQEIGAYAGLASVLGLAVLSALYFSQARDVKRLREWAGRAPERGTGVPGEAQPQRIVAQPQRPGAQPGQPRPGAPVVPGQPRPGVPPVPGQQQRPGGPPVPGQQRPGGPQVPGQQRPGTPALPTAAAAAGARPAAATPAAHGAGSGTSETAEGAAAGQAATGAQPGGTSVSGDAASGTGQRQDAGGATAGQSGGATPQPTQVLPAGGRPATPAAQRPGSSGPPLPGGKSAPLAPRGLVSRQTPIARPAQEPWYRTPRYLVLALVAVLVVGGGAAFAVTQLGGDDPAADTAGAGGDRSGGNGDRPARRAPVDPADVTVSVLNGTTVPGLARQVGDDVAAEGFKLGNVDNSPDSDQQRAESVIQFAQGHRRDAMAVGRRLGIAQREPIDAEVQQLAGDASVVVITGQDRNATP